MKVMLIGLVLGAALACAQEPKPFFHDPLQVGLFSANLAIGAVDAGQTCDHLAHGARELTLPTQSCAGVTAWIMGAKGVESGAQYLLYRHGHPRWAAAVPSVAIGASGVAIGYSFRPHGR